MMGPQLQICFSRGWGQYNKGKMSVVFMYFLALTACIINIPISIIIFTNATKSQALPSDQA